MTNLGELLRTRGLRPDDLIAIRNTLHPDDVSADFKTIEDVADANALQMYDRMQDGPVIDHDSLVLSFVAVSNGRARLTGFRKFLLRRQGDVPGDIVYDYDAAHLLHSFIARAEKPTFYNAIDEDGLGHLIDKLFVQWPEPLTRNIVRASDPGLLIIAE